MKLFLSVGLAALVVATAIGQTSGQKSGTLKGTVVDSSGAVVVGAKVTFKGPVSSQATVTNEDGKFSFDLLPVGFYALQVEKKAFRPADIKGIEIQENKSSDVRVALVPGKKGEVLEIIDYAISIDTTSSSPNNCIRDTEMESLPMDRNIAGAISMAGRCP